MRDYQRKYNGKRMPPTLYRRVLAIVRDYDRQCEIVNNIRLGSKINDGSGRCGSAGSPTESKAIRAVMLSKEIDAVNAALKEIPPEYRIPIFDNIRYGYKREEWVSKQDYAHRNTWSKWRMEFLWRIAEKLNLI